MDRAQLKDEVFMNMAKEISRLATCCRLKVGCVLLRPDGGIASAGFNGALPGMPHCDPGGCNADKRCLHTSHSEENALSFCSGEVKVAYLTHEPCLTCTRALVRRGVRRVVFEKPYTSISNDEAFERNAILAFHSVSWEQYKPVTHVHLSWDIINDSDDYKVTSYLIPLEHKMAKIALESKGKYIGIGIEDYDQIHLLDEWLESAEAKNMESPTCGDYKAEIVLCGKYTKEFFENAKKSTIISGFPGIGKTYFANSRTDVCDSDSSRFPKDNFPENYIQHIKECIGKYRYILVSSHKEVREALVANGIEFTLVYPSKYLKKEYLQRYKDRGSSDAFIKLLDENWDNWIDELKATPAIQVVLSIGQTLTSIQGII